MSALPFLIFGVLKPTIISEDFYRDWFTQERLVQFVSKGIASQATLYQEIKFPGIPIAGNSNNFLALVPTQKINGHDDLQHSLFPKLNDPLLEEYSNSEVMEVDRSEVRSYELIQDYSLVPLDSGRCSSHS
jgi:hypothetical protein